MTSPGQPQHYPQILKPEQSYTFADYFKLRFAPADILAEFGCTLVRQRLNLAQYSGELASLNDLRQRIEDTLPHISLTSETARREILISPIILELIRITGANLNIEYPIEVNDQLKGELDYYIYKQNRILIIEAKQADLTRGFTQLAVELIALSQWLGLNPNSTTPLIGAVSTGDIWQFGNYVLPANQITQDLLLYRVPDDLDSLMRVIINIMLCTP
ncbi:MAG: hypothetical protein KME21_03535 [Desmonostoc vinosum HA7617-LM4]|jgi:hypothetical protein|nr:hypothetical protein [Desmonostoc vinosum HA7617-LM4]